MNNTRVFRFLSIALLAAIALYFAAQGYFALTDPFTTTLVYQSSAEDTIDVSGWLVRDEEVLSGESGTVRHEVSEGERVGKGQTVATVYSGSDALDTVQQIEAKELQLQQLQFALLKGRHYRLLLCGLHTAVYQANIQLWQHQFKLFPRGFSGLSF